MGIEEEENKVNSINNVNSVTFPDVTVPQRSTTPAGTRKLKKKPKGDGYESDGGYLSDAGKKKDKKKSATAAPGVETEKEAKKRAKQEKKELQEEERQRKKSLTSSAKASKKAAAAESKLDYDTDGGGISSGKTFGIGKSKSKKTKSSKNASDDMGGAGYETDGPGYQSSGSGVKKSKTRFFKLSNKGSRPDLSGVLRNSNSSSGDPIPAVPSIPKEVVSLPIAERFATTLMSSLSEDSSHLLSPDASSSPLDRSASSTPLPSSGTQPFSSIPNSANTLYIQYPTPRSRGPIPFPSSMERESSASTDTSTSENGNAKRVAETTSPALQSQREVVTDATHKHGSGSGSHSTLHSPQTQQQQETPLQDQRPFSPISPPPSVSLKPPSISFPNSRSVSPAMSRSRSPLPSLFPPSSSPVPASSNLVPSTSPLSSPPVAPLHVNKGMRLRPSLENLTRTLRSMAGSPPPVSPISPHVMGNLDSPLLRSQAPSPALSGMNVSSQVQSSSRHAKPPSTESFVSRSPTLSPTQRSQRQIYISPPNTAMPTTTPVEVNDDGSHLTIVPPSPAPYGEYIVPSPRLSGLPPSPKHSAVNARLSGLPPSPNVLAYYDIPPPSPPPMGPLPSVPSSSSHVSPRISPTSASHGVSTNQDINEFISNPNQFPPAALLRQRVIDRTPRTLPAEFSTIQRGKESPFPSRPVLNGKPAASPMPTARRYQDLYPLDGYHDDNERARGKEVIQTAVAKSKTTKTTRFREAPSWIPGSEKGDNDDVDNYDVDGTGDALYGGIEEEDDRDDVDDEDGKDILEVLDGFVDQNSEGFEEHAGRALGRSRSFEALKDIHGQSTDVSDLPPARPRIKAKPIPNSEMFSASNNREGEYEFEDYDDADDRTLGNRSSRWSGSIYSRVSILDPDSSGQTRERLLKEVEAMMGKQEGSLTSNSRRRGEEVVPPVPRLPDAYANMNNMNAGGHINAGIINAGVTPERSWNRF